MGINVSDVQAGLSAAALCIASFFLLLMPPGPYASELIHTVQTGSFANAADARAQYDFIMHTVDRNKLEYLRIERIGEFYAVRIGQFEGFADAEGLFREMKSHFSDVLVMEAYIKDERIKKILNVPQPDQGHGIKEQSAAGPADENKDPMADAETAGEKTDVTEAARRKNREIDHLTPPPSLKRDLFSSGTSVRTLHGREGEEAVKKLELTATIIDELDPLAIISDEVLGIGGSVEGLEVTAIKNNEVILSKDGRQHILRMKKE